MEERMNEERDLIYEVNPDTGRVRVSSFSSGEKKNEFGEVPECSAFLSEDGCWMTLLNPSGLMEVYNLPQGDVLCLRKKWGNMAVPHCEYVGNHLIFDRGASIMDVDLSSPDKVKRIFSNSEDDENVNFCIVGFSTFRDEIVVRCSTITEEGKKAERTVRLSWPDGSILNDWVGPACKIVHDRMGGYYRIQRMRLYHSSTFPETADALGEEVQLEGLGAIPAPPKDKRAFFSNLDFMKILKNVNSQSVSDLPGAFHVSHDGKYVAIGSMMGKITRIYETNNWRMVQRLDESPASCHFSREGHFFLAHGKKVSLSDME